VYVTDYCHMMFWDGVTMAFADGGNRYMALFETAPGTGWALYDGGTYAYLTSAGATANITLPDLTSAGALAAFLEAGGVVSGPTAAVAPTFTGAAAVPAGIVSAPVFTGTPLAAHYHDAPIGIDGADNIYAIQVNGAGGAYSATTVVAGVADVSAVYALKTTADSAGTPAGTVSSPVFSGVSATPTGTISTTGEPRKLTRLPYFRR